MLVETLLSKDGSLIKVLSFVILRGFDDQLPVLLPRVQFTSVSFPQFRGQNTNYVDEEEEIHLQGQRCT